MTPQDFIAKVRANDRAALESALAVDSKLARCRDESGVSFICLAVYFGREDIARLLAERVTDLDIFEASTIGDAARVRDLIAARPELVDAYSPDGFHPLGYACFFGRKDVFDVLVSAGANLEAPAKNPMQVRPLHSAVAQSDPELALLLAQRLLLAGASPNVVQNGGFTPLHEAAMRGHLALTRLLLANGADPAVRTAENKSAAELAREHGHTEVLALLEPSGAR